MRFPVLVTALLAGPLSLQAQVPDSVQINGAVSAAPEAFRKDATVLGYDKDGKLVTLRAGTNEMICLADKPGDTRWAVACYHKDLEPFMRRGRELRNTGISRSAEDSLKLAEIKAGTLKMPDGPRTLYNLAAPGDSVDKATGLARGASGLPVVYIPYATAATTGLPVKPGDGLPWIMFPGLPWAHVMIMK